MATGPVVNQGKTAFLEEFLPENRDADLRAINRAWAAAGHGGTLSESLVSKTRSRLKIPRKPTASGGGPELKGKAKSPKASKAKVTPKAEQTPSQPQDMIPTGPNKTAFIREQLGRDGTLDAGAINRAWSGAGNEGTISDNLVYKTRASMGIGAGVPRPRAEKPVPPPPGRSPGSPSPLRLRRRHHPPGIPTVSTMPPGSPGPGGPPQQAARAVSCTRSRARSTR